MCAKMCDHSNGWRPEDGVPDLAMMNDITDSGINVNLRTRYKRDQIYTHSGSILIAVNPYKELNIYTPDWIARFRGQKLDQQDPHIFALTEAMYINLLMQDVSPPNDCYPNKPTPFSTSSATSMAKEESHDDLARQATISNVFKNQACIISGESGAGKTETTKFILSYLCSVTPNKSTWMEHQILEANTILEAFGNAKTVRNDNSSRFGKFIQVCFDSRYQINGCIIQDYLLEQSRVTNQSIGERNYHVFYQLIAAGQANGELRKKLHLMPANFYDYLNKTQCYKIAGQDDCAMFDSLRMAMSVLNMTQDSCEGLFSILSAILWLGNIQFQAEHENTISQNEHSCFTTNDREITKIISGLLEVEQTTLESILLKRQINVRGTVTEIPLNAQEARDSRNGMAKALYSRLFSWIVNFINASTNPDMDNFCFLGVLDIFGFENFDINSFEQLCINYANEKLHKFFNHHMFAMEQELYKREGIEFCDINYTDNTPCLELLERPPNCILRLLSEECRMPQGNDVTFLDKLHAEHSITNPHPYYIKGSDRRNWSREFSVRHYAGIVTYNVAGFLQKNRDTRQSQFLELIETSRSQLIRELVDTNNQTKSCFSRSESLQQNSFDSAVFSNRIQRQQSICSTSSISSSFSALSSIRRGSSFTSESIQSRITNSSHLNNNNSNKTKPTIADTFRSQLANLVKLLNSVHPWYVRCIKPNLGKCATDYDDRQVLQQLHYLGMSDLIKIRREGFPIHLTKHQFVCRYRCLMLQHLRLHSNLSPIKLDDANLKNYCERMIKHFELSQNSWRIGKTVVFLKTHSYQSLEERRQLLLIKMAILVQSFWRGHVQKCKYVRICQSAKRIQDTFRTYRYRLLYLRKKRAVLTIQAFVRGMFAREIANALREIKRAEELARQKAIEAERLKAEEIAREKALEAQRLKDTEMARVAMAESAARQAEQLSSNAQVTIEQNESDMTIVITEAPNSQEVTSESGVNQELRSSEDKNRAMNIRDRKEMEELVKVLERHGVELGAPDGGNFADVEKLYDVLGGHLQVTGDAQSMSVSPNEDDRISFATVGTTCDGDSVSCSAQSQISSTVTDDHDECDGDRKPAENCYDTEQLDSNRAETINEENDRALNSHDETKYHSNSIESIASLVSNTSIYSAQQLVNPDKPEDKTAANEVATNILEQIDNIPKPTPENRSTFPSNPIVVAGSKMVSNGRPLTRIEEEPNSATTSPAKSPRKSNPDDNPRQQSLFPNQEDPPPNAARQVLTNQAMEAKRRRLEHRILQVQQEQAVGQQMINPTTAGLLPGTGTNTDTNNSLPILETKKLDVENDDNVNGSSDESVYGVRKSHMLEFAELNFNNHHREQSGGAGMIRTLTRRRRSIDTNLTEYLDKSEMLSFNPSFSIPTSHIRLHDPHNVQISCSMFKNLCRYMTGENLKIDTEIRIIQSIIRNGLEKVELRDEIYVQIIRQLTNNPNQEHCRRLWILLGLVSAAFDPGKTFARHLTSYLQSKPKRDPSITCHAQFCLDNLQAAKLNSRKYPPSALEIQACKNLSNLSCKVYLLDGRCERISVHPCDTALDGLTKLAHKIGLQSIEGWALYESYTPGASKYAHPLHESKSDFERSIKAHSYLADLISSWLDASPAKPVNSVSMKVAQKRIDEGNFKLTLKKRIFRGPKIRNDPVEISLLYYQAVHNVVKKDSFMVDENLAIALGGLQARINLGPAVQSSTDDQNQNSGQDTKSSAHNKSASQTYEVEQYICQRLIHQNRRPKKEWSALIAQSQAKCQGANDLFCKMRYLSMVIYHCPLYGTATFPVTYKGFQAMTQNLLLGVNAEGLVLISTTDRYLIGAYRYADICMNNNSAITVYLDEGIIQVNVKDRTTAAVKCLSFDTTESEELAMLIASYSPAIKISIRGASNVANLTLDPSFELNVSRRKSKLKMTLEDRMRTLQEVQSSRRTIIKSGKLRKPAFEDHSKSLLRHTLRRLSSNKPKGDKQSRFDTLQECSNRQSNIPHTSSDYSLYGIINSTNNTQELNEIQSEIAGATAPTLNDEVDKTYPHRYWAYCKNPLKNSLLTIYDPDLEVAALSNFNAILTYSGLLPYQAWDQNGKLADNSSIDSGVVSQQSLNNNMNGRFLNGGSPTLGSSSSDIYDVCPKKIDERELLKLAQCILDRCLKKDADILKNEFFLQLIKQTTDHPEPNSEINQRHWQLLALACSVTFPSDSRILSYLYAHLRRCSLDQITFEGQFAQFTLRSLQGTLDTRGRKYAPAETEILSTINCRRVYARVYFLDGQFQAVEFDPCATIAEVVEQIKLKVGLRSDCAGYALFQPLDDDCEQVLQPEEKVGDAIAMWEAWNKQRQARLDQANSTQGQNAQQNGFNFNDKTSNNNSLPSSAIKTRTHRFVFKKYLFVDSTINLNDPVEQELLYFQTVASIKDDKFPVLEQEANILCALKAQIEIGDYTKLSNLPKEHIRMIYKQVVMSLMPPHAFNNLPIPAIAQQHQAFRELSSADAKKYFFNLIQSFGRATTSNNAGHVLLHRSHIYDATQTFAAAWPSDLWILISQSALHMLIPKSRRILASCEYRSMVDYNASNNYLIIVVQNANLTRMKYTFYTKQAQQIAQQMKDYILITSSDGNKKRKTVGFNLKQQTASRTG